jgi:hypothetical protein
MKIIWISGRWSTDLDWWYTIGKHAYHEAVKSDEAIMDDNFMCLKCIKIMRIKPLSKICLENNFERGRAGKGVCW